MNRLVIVGNGFDIAHNLKTKYIDFINWYCDKRIDALVGNTTKVSRDCLCKLSIKDGAPISCWNVFMFENSNFKDIRGNKTSLGYEVIKELQSHPEIYSVDFSQLFETILQSIETKGWVDIENDYYQLLKRCTENSAVKELNKQFAFLQGKLIEYLGTIRIPNTIETIERAIRDNIRIEDLSIEGKILTKKMDDIDSYSNNFNEERYLQERFSGLEPEHTMLLCFNYTGTVKQYEQLGGLVINYIHGELEHPENIIFGYGDELDKDYQDILDRNDNELLKNVKSVRYLETRNYHKMLDFLVAAPFQVLIMGHSCGNSDRTLLNTVFEHDNCVSIKPFYHQRADGHDNYLDLVQNISRNFTNMKLFRDRVVNKEQCSRM